MLRRAVGGADGDGVRARLRCAAAAVAANGRKKGGGGKGGRFTRGAGCSEWPLRTCDQSRTHSWTKARMSSGPSQSERSKSSTSHGFTTSTPGSKQQQQQQEEVRR